MPQRIQRRRAAGWRMPAGSIYVGRPTMWGNPFRVGQRYMPAVLRHEITAVTRPLKGSGVMTDFYVDGRPGIPMMPVPGDGPLTLDHVLSLYKAHILETVGERAIRERLHTHDLVCWCPLHLGCHADVLLELANR